LNRNIEFRVIHGAGIGPGKDKLRSLLKYTNAGGNVEIRNYIGKKYWKQKEKA
jgi:hypothetical protein